MNLKRNLVNYVTNFILALGLCFSFVYTLTTSMGLKYPPLYIAAAISCLFILYGLISYNKLVFRISGAILTAAALGAAFLLFRRLGAEVLLQYLESFIDWFYRFIMLQENIYNPTYNLILSALACVFISLFIFFFTFKKFSFIIILIAGSALFSSQWMLDFLVSHMSFYLFVFEILIYYFKHIYSKNSSREVNEYAYSAVFTFYTLPVCIIVLLIAFLIPAQSKPIEWKWLDKKINNMYHLISNSDSMFKFDYFSVASTGFGEDDGSLGGKVKKDKTYVMKVDAPRPLYLKAAVKDIYTGSSWLESDSSTMPYTLSGTRGNSDYDELIKNMKGIFDFSSSNQTLETNRSLQDYVELLAGMRILSNDKDFLKYFFTDNVKITYQNISTKSLFFSNNIFKINTDTVGLKSKTSGVMLSDSRLSKKFKYSYTAYTLKSGDKDLENILRKSYRGLYKDFFNNSNTINQDIAETLIKVSKSPSPTYEVLESLNFKALIYSQGVGEELPDNTQKVLEQYGISPRDKKIKAYDMSYDFGKTGFIAPLNEESRIYLDFNIESKEFPDLRKYLDISNVLIQNSDEAYQKYLQLPETLPDRVRNLALSITSPYDNQYDKVKAVEKYLSFEFPYTLSPKSTPKGRDFVDYFLFDIKEGYCTYYATSMAVLLRSAGIPARYVEGYALTSRPKNGTLYAVTNERAHAWVEAYFEGIGWIPFEPTSSFGSLFYFNRAESTYNYKFGFSENDEFIRNRPSIPDMNRKSDVPDLGNAQTDKKSFPVLPVLIIAMCIIVLAVLGIILTNAIRGFIKSRIPEKSSPKESIIEYYKYYLNLLSSAGLAILPGETPLVYSERIDKYLPPKPTGFDAITKVFILARYSPDPVSEKEKEFVKSYKPELNGKIKSRLGKYKYFLYKYLLGRFN